jgi:hypothetical protein
MGLVAFGAVFLSGLLLCCRYLAEPMARHPLLFGPLLVGATIIFSTAFYATFFARPTRPLEATTLSARGSLAAAMMGGKPAPQAETR